jgi:hypothetical protein
VLQTHEFFGSGVWLTFWSAVGEVGKQCTTGVLHVRYGCTTL